MSSRRRNRTSGARPDLRTMDPCGNEPAWCGGSRDAKCNFALMRLHLVEIHDLASCPQSLRDALTDFLAFTVNVGGAYDPAGPLLRRAIERTKARRIVDLCSGAGGPWSRLAGQVGVPVLLTDLYPHRGGVRDMSFYPESVDARKVPEQLDGFRTIFTAFHHFRPVEARAILEDAVRHRQGIGVFEVARRAPLEMALIAFTWLGTLALAPFIRPWRWSRLLWTYLPPVLRLVYTRRWVNKIDDRWDAGLWIMNADGSKNRFLVKGSNARWSPDGTRIAFFADGEPKGTQVFVRWMDAEGATSQVTHVSENPSNLSWSPDGRSLAFTMLVKSETPWKISMPMAPEGAKWTPAPRIVDRLHYRRDRVGFVEQGTTQILLVPAEGGTPRQLTTGDFATSELGGFGAPNYDWTPDGRTIVFDGLREPDADYRYRESYLYAVDVQSGTIKPLVSKKGGWTNPVISPDGRTVAFTGHEYGTFSYRADEVWTVGIDGSGMRALTTYDRDPGNVRWSPDGGGVFFALAEQGTSNVYFAGLRGGNRKVTDGDQMLSLSSVARDFTAVGVRTDATNPPDVARFSLKRSEEHTSELQSHSDLVCRLLLEKKKETKHT